MCLDGFSEDILKLVKKIYIKKIFFQYCLFQKRNKIFFKYFFREKDLTIKGSTVFYSSSSLVTLEIGKFMKSVESRSLKVVL